jgi:hypothetical protein
MVFRLALAALLVAGTVSLTACERDGPAEDVGEKIDDAAEKARDAVDPPKGPLEKAGRKIDRAVDD